MDSSPVMHVTNFLELGGFSGAYNVMGVPAISLPSGALPNGVLMGVMEGAAAGRDAALLSLAAALEADGAFIGDAHRRLIGHPSWERAGVRLVPSGDPRGRCARALPTAAAPVMRATNFLELGGFSSADHVTGLPAISLPFDALRCGRARVRTPLPCSRPGGGRRVDRRCPPPAHRPSFVGARRWASRPERRPPWKLPMEASPAMRVANFLEMAGFSGAYKVTGVPAISLPFDALQGGVLVRATVGAPARRDAARLAVAAALEADGAFIGDADRQPTGNPA
ncbi:MAG: hypothetical protein AAF318_16145 [Pseudomonadota bacterium]